jgi:beta-lactamase superfamily II metal-dependent hydrolase
MRLEIFDVEHGACSLLTADNNARLMIDCGHNATTGWKPGTHLKRQGITCLEMLAITNYDEDHASGSDDLFDNVYVGWLLRNKSVSGTTIKHLKRENGIGPGMNRLAYAMDYIFTGPVAPTMPEPQFQGLARQVFYNDYPKFRDENDLSMALFLQCHGVGVMFTGDLEKASFAELLKLETFRQALLKTNVYIAPHHGRDSGCCDELRPYLQNVFYVVISDKGYQYETQETLPFYQGIAKGGPYGFEQNRRVLTTRCDSNISFEFNPGSWGPRWG